MASCQAALHSHCTTMSPKLRPLQLPLLVEQRRKVEEAQCELDNDVAYTSSDATSPVTPCLSPRSHLRYSSSTSSFELATTPASSEGPSSPTQASSKSGKRFLPDVQEEPLEFQDSEDSDDDVDDASSDQFDLYGCLCDEPCIHRDTDLIQSTTDFTHTQDIEYDMGCMSDGDSNTSPQWTKKRRGGSESHFTGFSQRLGSRFPTLTRWKSTRQNSITSSPVSEYGFEQRPPLSRATSSRSSSISASGRYQPDHSHDTHFPPTPALSCCGSSDSIILPKSLDIEKANTLGPLIERERALATTPLLPPLMTDKALGHGASHPSPLEWPTIDSTPTTETNSPLVQSPPLSAKPSNSSFSRIAISIPEQDAWADRLGHANFTILPPPYKPDTLDLEAMRQLRCDWDAARVNYTKHLVRTGEHYGVTSKTYALTEAKWAEIDRTWRRHHDETAEAVIASGTVAPFTGVTTTIPRMDAEGKFPERGDMDIVGPMVREATLTIVSPDGTDRRNPSFWRNLAGRVGLRK